MDWQNSSEEEFFIQAKEFLFAQHEEIEQQDEEMRIELVKRRIFKQNLIRFLDIDRSLSEFIFRKENCFDEKCDCDMRMYMDEEIKMKTLQMGYLYIEESSTAASLLFKKIK